MPNVSKEISKRTGRKERKKRPDGSNYSLDPKERALQLRDDGKIGPQFAHHSRERKPRVAQDVAAFASDKRQLIKQAFLKGLTDKNPKVAMQAANDLLAIERQESQLQLDEDKLEHASRDDLVIQVMALLNDPVMSSSLGIEVVDGTAEEITDAEEADA